jgi:hypothetical protein
VLILQTKVAKSGMDKNVHNALIDGSSTTKINVSQYQITANNSIVKVNAHHATKDINYPMEYVHFLP